jgi:putative DNA primase/helicase
MFSSNPEEWKNSEAIMGASQGDSHQPNEYISRSKRADDGGLPINALVAFNTTDLGNAERMAYYFKHKIRYVKEWGWLIFDGTRWRRDEIEEVMQIARATSRRIYQEAAQCDEEQKRSALGKWAIQSESEPRLRAMVRLAQSEPNICLSYKEFDADPLLFNCANGTIDLRSGELLPHDPYSYLMKCSGIIYDLNAPCPLWEKSLSDMMNGDMELAEYIQRAVGYSLTAMTEEQCLFFLYGTGKNGKSLFAETLRRVLGDYWMKAPASMLMMKRSDRIPNDVARLPGARMVVSSETTAGHRMDEALVKDLTGDDIIAARFLNKEFFEFKPSFKLWMYGNYKPTIRGSDDGI